MLIQIALRFYKLKKVILTSNSIFSISFPGISVNVYQSKQLAQNEPVKKQIEMFQPCHNVPIATDFAACSRLKICIEGYNLPSSLEHEIAHIGVMTNKESVRIQCQTFAFKGTLSR